MVRRKIHTYYVYPPESGLPPAKGLVDLVRHVPLHALLRIEEEYRDDQLITVIYFEWEDE